MDALASLHNRRIVQHACRGRIITAAHLVESLNSLHDYPKNRERVMFNTPGIETCGNEVVVSDILLAFCIDGIAVDHP